MRVNNTLFRINHTNLEVDTFNFISIRYIQLMLMICVLIFFCPLSAFSNNQENLKLLRERIQSLQKDLASKEALKQDTTDALQKTEHAINNFTLRLNKLIANDRQASDEYKQLQKQHSQIRDKIEIERNQLERLLYQQYVGGQQD